MTQAGAWVIVLETIMRRSSLSCGLALLASLSMSLAHGSMTASVPVDIRTQIANADHVVRAEVVEVQLLGEQSTKIRIGRCGMLYRLRVQEQFKGSLRQSEWFATDRILFPQRPLSVGDHVLVLLRDVTRTHPRDDKLMRTELDYRREEMRACGPERTTLYLFQHHEEIFPIVTEKNSAGGSQWMQFSYSGNTIVPADVQPRKAEVCEPQAGGGCIITEPERVAWTSMRKALKRWMWPVQEHASTAKRNQPVAPGG